MQRKVPFFDYQDFFNRDKEALTEIFQEVGSRGAFILQRDLTDFERNLAEYTGAKYVIGTSNATDSIMMGVKAAGLGPGDEVIFCSHTFIATAAPVAWVGATPVPVEAGPDHEIDPESVRKAITPKTKAIMPTQLNGRCCDMDELQKICDEHNLILLEDSAQGLGATYKGKMAGTFGLAGCYSFYPAKVLGTLGDGGAFLTNDETVYEKCKQIRDHGRNEKTGEVESWGMNFRLDNLQAAFLNYKLKEFPKVVERRREIAALYNEALSDLEQLDLPPAPTTDGDHFDTYQNYELEANNRDELKNHLAENGIGTMVQWGGKAVHQFKKLNLNATLPKTEKMFERMLMLPINMTMSNDDVAYVCEKVKEFYQK